MNVMRKKSLKDIYFFSYIYNKLITDMYRIRKMSFIDDEGETDECGKNGSISGDGVASFSRTLPQRSQCIETIRSIQ